MSPVLVIAGAILFGYILGSIPAGYLAGRMAGIDIRQSGSGNIGATNVVRVLGKRYGYAVFVFDFLKGLAAVLIARLVAKGEIFDPHLEEIISVIAGVSCVLGHSFPIWLKFKGGKGVATSIGVLFGLMPSAAIIVLLVWMLTFELTRYVSVASIVAAVALPLAVAVITYIRETNGTVLLCFAVCLTGVIVFRHRSNLSRLMQGTEPRFHRRR